MNSTKKVHFLKHTVLLDPVFSQLQLSTQAVITTSTVGAYCFLNSNGTIYDLNPIRRGDYDFNRTFTNQDRLTVNMCSKANYNCVNRTALATYRTFQNQCIALSGDEKAFTNYTINFDNVTNQTTLNAYLPAGDVCKTNANAKYQMTYNLICDKNASTPIFNANNFDINKCSNEITITTTDACPQFNIYGLWKALMENKYAFGSTILVLGIILAYFGNKFIVFTQIMTGVLITLFVALYFIMAQLSFSLEIWQFWLIIGLCAALGIVAGYFMSQIEWLVPVLLAAFVGFVGGELAYTVAFKYVQSNPVAVYWCIIVVCVLIGAIIGYYFNKGIIIVATGIIGAYAFMRGAAFMIGYYPDEKQVYQLTQKKEWDQVDKLLTWHVYIYFVVFLAVAISGIYVQCKYFNKTEEEKQKEENEAKEKLMAEQNAPKQAAQN